MGSRHLSKAIFLLHWIWYCTSQEAGILLLVWGAILRKKGLQKRIGEISRALEQGFATVYRRNFDSDIYEYMGEHIKEITGYSSEELTPDIWDRWS